MQGTIEKTILNGGTVRITNLRAIFGTKSYALSNITSASMRVYEPSLFIPIFLAINLGVCVALIALTNLREYAVYLEVALYLVVAALIFFLISRKTKYEVKISNPVSELTVIQTYNGEFAQRVVRALNEAIANLDE